MRKILKKKIWSHGTPLGYLGSLSRVHIMEFFQNLMGLVLWGLEVTPIPVSALVDFTASNQHSDPMCSKMAHFKIVPKSEGLLHRFV